MSAMHRWRGLKALVHDAVEHGSRAIERVHLETARRPFAIVEMVPGVGEVAQIAHVVHDAVVSTSYGMVRVVNDAASAALDVALDAIEPPEPPSGADR